MCKDTVDFEPNIVCEAVGCLSNAAINMTIKVGDRGTISLRLCRDCAEKKFGYNEVQEIRYDKYRRLLEE